MCLITKNQPEFLVAEKDIICFKQLRGGKSKHMGFQYKKGVPNKQVELTAKIDSQFDDDEENFVDVYSVDPGYHSRISTGFFKNNAIFYIPKGTKYAKGGENDYNKVDNYVSENIVYYGWNNFINRFLFKLKRS